MDEEENKVEEQVLKHILKEEKAPHAISPDGLYYFKPALHIDPAHEHTYVSIPIAVPKIVKGVPHLDTETIVVYKNGRFPLTENELVSRGIFPINIPALTFPARWTLSDINDFTTAVETVETDDYDRSQNYNYDTYSIIKDTFDYFMDFPIVEEYGLYTVWSMMTCIYPIFHAVPFINLTGFSGSGKSKVIAIFQQLCFNAETTTSTSPAAMYHAVEQNMSTILIDEGEKLTGIEKDPDLRLLLNACYKKGGAVMRWNPDAKKIERNYVFAPCAIAAINPLEPTLLSRCISRVSLRTITKKGNKDVTETSHPWQDIRNRLYRFIFSDAPQEIENIYLNEDFGNLKCRHLEKWKPLLSIAKYLDLHGGDGKVYPDIQKLAEEEQDEGSILTETEEIAIRSIDTLVQVGGEYYIKDIKKQMGVMLEAEGNSKALEFLSNKTIGSILRKFGFSSGKHKEHGVPYRINRGQIEKLYQRYALPPSSSSDSTVSTGSEAKPTDEISLADIEPNI